VLQLHGWVMQFDRWTGDAVGLGLVLDGQATLSVGGGRTDGLVGDVFGWVGG